MTQGVLADYHLEDLARDGAITSHRPITPEQFQPASLDLRLGAKAYRVRASFLSGRGQTIAQRLASLRMHEIDLRDGAVLERGCVYVTELLEGLALPDDLHAVANAKSSTGRLDILTRLVTEGGNEFDRVAAGYTGPLYAEICPLSFSVLARQGSRLNQIRFRRGRTVLTDAEHRELHESHPVTDVSPQIDGGLGFSVDLSSLDRPAGYRARQFSGLVDLDRVAAHDPDEFWEPVTVRQGQLILDPHAFYILVSKESVSIPPTHAAEMAPYIAMIGEFRVHYAGFFDPGFGHHGTGGRGSRAVLEVRCHQTPFLLEDGQLVGRLVYERMVAPPRRAYGSGSSYQGQGLKLSKHFRSKVAKEAHSA